MVEKEVEVAMKAWELLTFTRVSYKWIPKIGSFPLFVQKWVSITHLGAGHKLVMLFFYNSGTRMGPLGFLMFLYFLNPRFWVVTSLIWRYYIVKSGFSQKLVKTCGFCGIWHLLPTLTRTCLLLFSASLQTRLDSLDPNTSHSHRFAAALGQTD